MKEFVFEFFDNINNQVVSIGYKLSDGEINEILNLLEWNQFEKHHNTPESWEYCDEKGIFGYRVGWGYNFGVYHKTDIHYCK